MYSIEGADGRSYGPVTLDELVQWAREGRVVAKTAVVDHETGRRFLACDVAEVSTILQQPVSTMTRPAERVPVIDIRSDARPPSRWRRARTCPRCGGFRIARVSSDATAFACCSCLFAPILLPLVFFLPGRRRVCNDCGFEW